MDNDVVREIVERERLATRAGVRITRLSSLATLASVHDVLGSPFAYGRRLGDEVLVLDA